MNQLRMHQEEVLDFSREVVRSSIYRIEKKSTLLQTQLLGSDSSKKIGGVKCCKKYIKLVYKTEEVEKSYDQQQQKVIRGIMGGNSKETVFERNFKVWIDPTKQGELAFVGSLIGILVDEIPALVSYKPIFEDISQLFVQGWPVQLTFEVEKNICASFSFKPPREFVPKASETNSFEIPK